MTTEIATLYIMGNIIVGLEWSDPLDYVATLCLKDFSIAC